MNNEQIFSVKHITNTVADTLTLKPMNKQTYYLLEIQVEIDALYLETLGLGYWEDTALGPSFRK